MSTPDDPTPPSPTAGLVPADLREFFYRSKFYRGSVAETAARLPVSDAELDAWIAEATAQSDEHAFTYLVFAALTSGRPVSVRHLERGASLTPNATYLGFLACHLQGDLPEPAMRALTTTIVNREGHALLLLLVACWCREHRGGVLPPELIPDARLLARGKELQSIVSVYLWALAVLTNDAGLRAVLARHLPDADPQKIAILEESARKVGETSLETFRGPVAAMLHDTPQPHAIAGYTMRRAVAHVGRNDPCHCGSGKKYKRCCEESDRLRLRESSEVAGKTVHELEAAPEIGLTYARLEKMGPADLGRMDPAKVPEDLRETFIAHMGCFALHEQLVAAMRLYGYDETNDGGWRMAFFQMVRAGAREALSRVLLAHPSGGEARAKLDFGARLLLAGADPASYLAEVEAEARRAVVSEDSEFLQKFGYGLLVSSHRALGIFVARSLIPLCKPGEATFLFNQILEARDRLDLPPDDPFADIADERATKAVAHAGREKDAEALRAAQSRLETKAAEVRQLQENLDALRREVVRREAPPPPALAPAPAAATAASPPPPDDRPLRELRERIHALKADLKTRHAERDAFRRELQRAHEDLDAFRQQQTPPPTSTAASPSAEERAEAEEAAQLLPDEGHGGHEPIRLIEFPPKFHGALGAFPRHVARGALALLGRLAAGEPAAFFGVVRLKAHRDVLRARVGLDHRLLFRLLPDRVQVVTLINRRDLERTIKGL